MFSVKKSESGLEGTTLESFVLDKLINVGTVRDLETPMPEGVKVLDIEKSDGLVTVNFSKEFQKNGITKDEAGIVIASVVNTLTLLDGNETVEIKVEGKLLNEYYGVDISEPVKFVEAYFPDK